MCVCVSCVPVSSCFVPMGWRRGVAVLNLVFWGGGGGGEDGEKEYFFFEVSSEGGIMG